MWDILLCIGAVVGSFSMFVILIICFINLIGPLKYKIYDKLDESYLKQSRRIERDLRNMGLHEEANDMVADRNKYLKKTGRG